MGKGSQTFSQCSLKTQSEAKSIDTADLKPKKTLAFKSSQNKINRNNNMLPTSFANYQICYFKNHNKVNF